VPFYATKLCDDYGLDTWSLELILFWLTSCYEAGVLTEESIGLPLSKMGSWEFIETLVKMISFRQGFGEVLSRGLVRAGKEVGGDAGRLVKYLDNYEPRLYITTALLFATEPRVPIQALHEVGHVMAKWVSWAKGCEGTYVTSDVIRGIAKRFWGSEAAADFTTTEGKALAARMIQDRQYAKECLVVCDVMYPITEIKYSEDHSGDPNFESRVLSAVVGIDTDEQGLYRFGERVFNLQRAIIAREGHRGRQDDALPDEWHTVPLEAGVVDPDCLVPGKNGEKASRVGAVVDKHEFERMKDEYYRIRGWDVAVYRLMPSSRN